VWSYASILPLPNGIKRDKVTFTLILEEMLPPFSGQAGSSFKKLVPAYKLHGVLSQKAVVLAFTIKITQKFMHK
jgi:hypothetical protein